MLALGSSPLISASFWMFTGEGYWLSKVASVMLRGARTTSTRIGCTFSTEGSFTSSKVASVVCSELWYLPQRAAGV